MNRRILYWGIFAVLATLMTLVQFIPAPPVQVPALLPADQREPHRTLNFEGIANFRDLGGYQTAEGRTVKWGRLYRSASLATASRADHKALTGLGLAALIDFRSAAEKAEEPPPPAVPGLEVIEIPLAVSGGNSLHGQARGIPGRGEFSERDQLMIETNRRFVDDFSTEFSGFFRTLIRAAGEPVAWHCATGRDASGYAAAVLLRLLGVPVERVIEDYMLSRDHPPRTRQGRNMLAGEDSAAAAVPWVSPAWLEAAFQRIDERYGDFGNYLAAGLGLSPADIQSLRKNLLE